MTTYFPVVIEKVSNGTFSAWVAGLPAAGGAVVCSAGVVCAHTPPSSRKNVRRAFIEPICLDATMTIVAAWPGFGLRALGVGITRDEH